MNWAPDRPAEITDLICRYDSVTGLRLPVTLSEVVSRLQAGGQRHAERVVRRLPYLDGVLDERAVDALMVRVHCELQRLAEELQLPRRVAATLGPILANLRDLSPGRPVRVVDVGCGLGYVVRWLAAHNSLGPDCELVGVDLNRALVQHAARLARTEYLGCRFVTGNAFDPGRAIDDPQRTVVVSTGLLHHLNAPELVDFFGAQQTLGVHAFAHWDLDPCRLANVGAWVFHYARMREPVSRHDGVLSARRAYPAGVLLDAAGRGAPDYDVRCSSTGFLIPAVTEVLRPIVGHSGRS